MNQVDMKTRFGGSGSILGRRNNEQHKHELMFLELNKEKQNRKWFHRDKGTGDLERKLESHSSLNSLLSTDSHGQPSAGLSTGLKAPRPPMTESFCLLC